MDSEVVKRVKANPKYQELVIRRSCYAWILSVSMLIIYYAFIVIVAFWPKSLGTKISPESVISVGIPLGVAIICSAFVLTGLYVRRANTKYDELIRQIKEEAK
ncbi:MAG: DUF485 domain-containing protein [Magnetococcales bacterium]|nr:DUF485 domain-containing protein [Magnetococcales bacterium]MBF0116098.1 DUF485 domain-containing protein [Magnetococcales bacterium]